MNFFGETSINLDVKGRMALPTRYRESVTAACQNQLVLTYNPYESHSLFLYPREKWLEVRDKVMALSSNHPDHRWMQRQLVGSAAPVEPDGNWRFQIPQQLRQVAELDKKIILMGLGDRFELWSEETLEQSRSRFMQEQKIKMEAAAEISSSEVSQQLQNLSL